MVIDIKENSVHLGINEEEMEVFCSKGYIENKAEFNHQSFVYALQKKDDIPDVEAEYKGLKITIFMPTHLVDEWKGNDIIGYGCHTQEDSGKKMAILVEKRFKKK